MTYSREHEKWHKKRGIKTSKHFSLKLKMFRIFFMLCRRSENTLAGGGWGLSGRHSGPFKGLRTSLGKLKPEGFVFLTKGLGKPGQ